MFVCLFVCILYALNRALLGPYLQYKVISHKTIIRVNRHEAY